MGYSDHIIVFATLGLLCILLVGSTLDVVMAHDLEEGEEASKASKASQASKDSKASKASHASQGEDKIKNDSDEDNDKKSSSGHESKHDEVEDKNKKSPSEYKIKSHADEDNKKSLSEDKSKSDADGDKDKKSSNGDINKSDIDDKKSSSGDKKSPSGDKSGDNSQNDTDEDMIKNDSVAGGPNRGNPEQAAWIEPQDKARAEVGLGPLTWNTTIEAYAKNYANQRAADCKLEHSDSKGVYGECIETSGPGKYPTPAEIVRWWVDEEKPFYDASAKKCKGGVCGHYMQVINPNTNQLGCATVPCKGNKGYFSTCNYNW